MLVIASVDKVSVLDSQSDRSPMRSVSLEGLSVLVPADVPVPVQGDQIKAQVRVVWRSGKRPIHFLGIWRSTVEAL